MRSPRTRMNPSFQRVLKIQHFTIVLEPASMRHFRAIPQRVFPRAFTARLFCGKMFGVSDEKSWQQSAWFSDSDRTCGQKQARCEQLVSNSRISNPSKAVTDSSPKSAGTSRREKVNICVPRCASFETASPKRFTVSKEDFHHFFVERKRVSNVSHSAAFSLLTAAIL